MAIAFDATTSGVADADTLTVAHTVTGTLPLLVVVTTIDGAETMDAGFPTYNGAAMTLVGTVAPGNFRVYMHYLTGVTTSGANIVANISGSQDYGLMACSYTGVLQASPLDGTAAGADDNASPFGRAITTAVDGSVVVMGAADDHDSAAGRAALAGTNERKDILQGSGAGDYGGYMADKLTTTAGSHTITYTDGSVSASTCFIAAFKADTGEAPATALKDPIFSPGIVPFAR